MGRVDIGGYGWIWVERVNKQISIYTYFFSFFIFIFLDRVMFIVWCNDICWFYDVGFVFWIILVWSIPCIYTPNKTSIHFLFVILIVFDAVMSGFTIFIHKIPRIQILNNLTWSERCFEFWFAGFVLFLFFVYFSNLFLNYHLISIIIEYWAVDIINHNLIILFCNFAQARIILFLIDIGFLISLFFDI